MVNLNQIEFLTIKETASRLRVSTSTLRRFIKNGKINVIKVGGGIRISNQEILNFLSKNRNKEEKIQIYPVIDQKVEGLHTNPPSPKNPRAHYIIPGINSIEAETLETIISEDITLEEIMKFLKEERYDKLLKLLNKVVEKYKMDSRKSLILLFIEEAIYNLSVRKEILIDLVTIDKALMILPVPPHLFFYFSHFLSLGQIINSEDKIPPHLEPYKGIITNVDDVSPALLHQKFSETRIVIVDGFKTKNGYLVRRPIANLLVQYLEGIKKIYLYNIPNIPKDQNFALLENDLLSNKIINI